MGKLLKRVEICSNAMLNRIGVYQCAVLCKSSTTYFKAFAAAVVIVTMMLVNIFNIIGQLLEDSYFDTPRYTTTRVFKVEV